MMTLKSSSEDTPFLSDINMIPLIDVSLVLLIIFMIITPYMILNSIQVQLPKSASTHQPPTQNVVISIEADGTVSVDRVKVEEGQLASRISQLMPQKIQSAVIFADKRVSVSTVVDVIDQVEAGGVHRISLTTERKAR
jgi:biopolymer transport protein ExbD